MLGNLVSRQMELSPWCLCSGAHCASDHHNLYWSQLRYLPLYNNNNYINHQSTHRRANTPQFSYKLRSGSLLRRSPHGSLTPVLVRRQLSLRTTRPPPDPTTPHASMEICCFPILNPLPNLDRSIGRRSRPKWGTTLMSASVDVFTFLESVSHESYCVSMRRGREMRMQKP